MWIDHEARDLLAGTAKCQATYHYRDCACHGRPVMLRDWKGDSVAIALFQTETEAEEWIFKAEDTIRSGQGYRPTTGITPIPAVGGRNYIAWVQAEDMAVV